MVGIVLQQLDRRRQIRETRDKERQDALDARPDEAVKRLTAALDRAEKQAAAYSAALEAREDENAELRAKYQASLDDRDRLVGENRDLKRQLEEARIECNRMKGQQ